VTEPVDWDAIEGRETGIMVHLHRDEYEAIRAELTAKDARIAELEEKGEYAWQLAQSMIPPEALEAAEREVARLTDLLRENKELGIAIAALSQMADSTDWLGLDFQRCARGALAAIAQSATRAALAPQEETS